MRFLSQSRGVVARLVLVGALSLSPLFSAPIWAQVAGATISGTVTDASGAVIPNVQILIKNRATGVTRNVTTDSVGVYSAPNILPGRYDVTISAPGFSTQVQSGVTLAVGTSQLLDISLQVGDVSQQVLVTATTPGVQLEKSSIGAQVSGTTIREMSLNGRDWTTLATLQPGIVAIPTQPSTATTAGRGNRGYGYLLSNAGHSPWQNVYRVNGISINDYANGSPGSVLGVNLGVDAIEEFSVATTNYSADYGRTSGAVINAIMKSGTNAFHGSAYEFLRDDRFDARNFFDPKVIPPFHRNEFGVSAGGPIRKDKTFIFGDYEGLRQTRNLSFPSIVPTAAARGGNLCSVPTASATPCTPTTITVDPLVKPFLPLYPLPNGGITATGRGDTGIFSATGEAIGMENYVTGRGDHKISDKTTLAGSFFRDFSTLTQPDALLIGVHGFQALRLMIGLELTRIFSPTVVNTVRLGFSRTSAVNQKPVKALNPLGADPSLGTVPGQNAPILNVPGLTTMQGALNAPSFSAKLTNSYQVYDDLFLTRGKQSIKVGFSFERLQYNDKSRFTNGQWNFPSLQGFLQNQPSALASVNLQVQGYNLGQSGLRQSLFGLYVQNDWRVRRNFTMNIGLRYEPMSNATEAHNNFAIMKNFYQGTPTLNTPHLWERNPTLRNFAPRVGFAWDPFRNGKTAIRAGFGIYDVLPGPWQTAVGFTNTIPFTAQGTIGSPAAGSFPTKALDLFKPDSTTLRNRFVEPRPGRSYAMNWNLNVQQQVTPNVTVMVAYVASRAAHLVSNQENQNMVLPTLTSAGYLWPFPVGSGRVLNPEVGGIKPTWWDGSSFYRGLQAGITKRMSHGFQVQGSYSWSRCRDDNETAATNGALNNSVSGIQFFNNPAKRGPCDFNMTHVFSANYIWRLPTPRFGGEAAKHILGNWQVGGIVSATTGTPFTLTLAGDPLGQRISDVFAVPNRLTGAGCEGNPVNPGNIRNYIKLECFTPPVAPPEFAARCQPAAAAVAALIPNTCMNLFGNAKRGSLIGPGLVNFDFSAFKNIPIRRVSESFNVQLRFEFFNILNHPNFQSPLNNKRIFNANGTAVGGAGLIDTTTTDARQIQFALRVNW